MRLSLALGVVSAVSTVVGVGVNFEEPEEIESVGEVARVADELATVLVVSVETLDEPLDGFEYLAVDEEVANSSTRGEITALVMV